MSGLIFEGKFLESFGFTKVLVQLGCKPGSISRKTELLAQLLQPNLAQPGLTAWLDIDKTLLTHYCKFKTKNLHS